MKISTKIVEAKVDEYSYLTQHQNIGINQFTSTKDNININLSGEELYLKKQKSRQIRQNNLDLRQILFIKSIFELQLKLNLNDYEFCALLGIKSKRTIQNWKNLCGHFPSKRVLRRIIQLKNQDNIVIIVNSNKLSLEMRG